MGDVIQLGQPATADPEPQGEIVWRCDCGCLTFYLCDTGEIECSACGNNVVGDETTPKWCKRRAAPTEEVPDAPNDALVLVDLNSPEMAMKRIVRKINPGDTDVVAVINRDGGVHVSGGVTRDDDDDEYRAWLTRRVQDMTNILFNTRKDGENSEDGRT